jgi:aminoglycoside phosphotransferase (APT) family kinase protein
MDTDIPISGGRTNRGRLFRRGNTVVRPLGEDQITEKILTAIAPIFDGAPSPLGRDGEGHLLIEWVEGAAPELLGDRGASERAILESVGLLLRRLHDATGPIASSLSEFSSGLSDPSRRAEVICHNDPTPGNMVFRDGVAVALIDWEYVATGRRAWDLATALRFWSPLRHPENLRPGEETLDFLARARWLLDGYGASQLQRIETTELLRSSQGVAAQNAIRVITARGADGYEGWVNGGGLSRIALDGKWLNEEHERLIAVLR